MDKLFGEIDYVEAGERQAETQEMEIDAYREKDGGCVVKQRTVQSGVEKKEVASTKNGKDITP